MSREQRIAFGMGAIGLGIILYALGQNWLGFVALGLIGLGLAQFLRLPKDNLLPFHHRRPHKE